MVNHENVISALFELSPDIRYVAILQNSDLTLQQRAGLVDASAGETDRFEELVVNPTLLTLARQRGAIDCGGLRFLVVAYGNFFQLLREVKDGHISICLSKEADVLNLSSHIYRFLESRFPGLIA